MYELSLLFFQIAIFKKGPQDVPASAFVLRLLLPVYVAINYLILFLNGAQTTAILQILADFAMIVLFCWPFCIFPANRRGFRKPWQPWWVRMW